MLSVLGACSSSWKAPLETRSPGRAIPAPVQRRPDSVLSGTYYRVQAGDTLYSIAWRSGKDFRDIARWNGIGKPYRIYKGQRLRLRPAQTAPSPKAKRRSEPGAVKRKSAERKTQKNAPRTTRQSRPRAAVRKGPLRWQWPNNGAIKSTYKRGDRLRKGVKLAGKAGDPVRAAEGGKVVYSGSGLIGYGRLIIVKHNDKFLSAYGHNRKLLAKQGQQVTKGQQIAEMGLSNDGKPLLHFEIRRDGKPVNPMALLPKR